MKTIHASMPAPMAATDLQQKRVSALVTVTVKPLDLSDVKSDAVADWDAPSR